MTTNPSPPLPVALPTVRVTVDSSGAATVIVDGDPHAVPQEVAREAVEDAIREIANAHGPVRVHLTESDGSRFTDILLPASTDCPAGTADAPPTDAPSPTAPPRHPGVAGTGFLPTEHVDVAVIIANLRADAEGNARLRLPAAVVGGRAVEIVLLRRVSGSFTVCDPS